MDTSPKCEEEGCWFSSRSRPFHEVFDVLKRDRRRLLDLGKRRLAQHVENSCRRAIELSRLWRRTSRQMERRADNQQEEATSWVVEQLAWRAPGNLWATLVQCCSASRRKSPTLHRALAA